IGFVAYSPLGRGFLTGQIRSPDDFAPDDRRRMFPRFQAELFAKNLKLVEELESIAKARQVTAAQLSLAWVLAQGKDIVAIPGTRKPQRVDENAQAGSISLSALELTQIEAVCPKGAASGERYPDM